ncbi:MAG TPA: glycosyltransferase family 4 protein [Solirubrobacteraceae bacterium]|nr:glycosyltransferase family 4 protein [Solirubrobacteraceae bacterium]
MQEIVEALDRREQPRVCICETTAASPPSAAPRRGVHAPRPTTLLAPLVRFSPALRIWTSSVEFDAHAARGLPTADHLVAFNGTALAQFRAARRTHCKSLSLVAANSHLRRVVRRHARAYRQYPLERPWATRLLKRNLAEYAQADRIYVASRYAWESFVEEGFSEAMLSLFPLTPDPRYAPDSAPRTSATFDIVYIGGLTVNKGVPLLLDAIRRVPYADMRLVLVGGWKTRGMRRFIQKACAEDSRIDVCPGDPLPHLLTARLCVHPAYEDGFAYAPAEALACGVPVIVSEDTGMKDLIDPNRNGLILPTGDLEALTESIEAAYRGEIFNDNG